MTHAPLPRRCRCSGGRGTAAPRAGKRTGYINIYIPPMLPRFLERPAAAFRAAGRPGRLAERRIRRWPDPAIYIYIYIYIYTETLGFAPVPGTARRFGPVDLDPSLEAGSRPLVFCILLSPVNERARAARCARCGGECEGPRVYFSVRHPAHCTPRGTHDARDNAKCGARCMAHGMML